MAIDLQDVHAPLLNDDDLPIERLVVLLNSCFGLFMTNVDYNRHTSYQAIETIDVKKEQEFWNAVLERTTR